MILKKDNIDYCFDAYNSAAEVIEALYHLVIPYYDYVKQIDGWPIAGHQVSMYIMEKFIEFDRKHDPDVFAGGAWLNSGFSTLGSTGLEPWEVDISKCKIEYNHINDFGNGFFQLKGTSSLCYVGENPTTIEKAWEITINKWTILSKTPIGDGGVETCGLCMFASGLDGKLCFGCPVDNAGHTGCTGTAYLDYVHDGTVEAAQRELDFLLKIKGEDNGISD